MMLLLPTIPFWLKGKAFDGENREKYIKEKVNAVKMLIDDVMCTPIFCHNMAE